MRRRRDEVPHRARVLPRALRQPSSFGPVSIPIAVGLGVGFAASFVADAAMFGRIGSPARQLLDAAVFAAVAAPLWIVTEPKRVRDAHEVLAWLNAWETERWSREVGRRLPALPRAKPALLDELPDTLGLRPLRVELLAARGEITEARQRLEQLPVDTPWQRFERAALHEWIGWCSREGARFDPMRQAIADLDEPDRRLAARAMLAAAEARRAAEAGADATLPLAALRPELGRRLARYAFGYRTGIVVSVLVIGLVASLSVALVWLVIR